MLIEEGESEVWEEEEMVGSFLVNLLFYLRFMEKVEQGIEVNDKDFFRNEECCGCREMESFKKEDDFFMEVVWGVIKGLSY